MQPIIIYEITDGKTFCTTPDELKQTGISEQDLRERFADSLTVHTVQLKDALDYTMHQQVERACFANGQRDEIEAAPARAEAFVASWTFQDKEGKPLPVSKQGYRSLHPLSAITLDNEIQAAIYPNLMGNTRFFQLYRDKQKPPSN